MDKGKIDLNLSLTSHESHVHTSSSYLYIDESFLGFEGFARTKLEDHCQQMRYVVRRNTGIPVSVGISTSRTLALSVENQTWLKDLLNMVFNLCK
nr:hypothetical protein [uncultured Halomonas sp.]